MKTLTALKATLLVATLAGVATVQAANFLPTGWMPWSSNNGNAQGIGNVNGGFTMGFSGNASGNGQGNGNSNSFNNGSGSAQGSGGFTLGFSGNAQGNAQGNDQGYSNNGFYNDNIVSYRFVPMPIGLEAQAILKAMEEDRQAFMQQQQKAAAAFNQRMEEKRKEYNEKVAVAVTTSAPVAE